MRRGSPMPRYSLRSDAFRDGQRIPVRHTADGENLSPPLTWSGIPEAAYELAIVMEDLDAPQGPVAHWLIWGILPDSPGLPEGIPTTPHPRRLHPVQQGTNDFGSIGYRGPAPPPGQPHRYRFTLYMLRDRVGLSEKTTLPVLEQRLQQLLMSSIELTGIYEREHPQDGSPPITSGSFPSAPRDAVGSAGR